MHLDGRATLCCGRGRFCADSYRIRFSMSKPTIKILKCMIPLIGFMILRFFVLILEIVKYKTLITSFFLRFCALLRSCRVCRAVSENNTKNLKFEEAPLGLRAFDGPDVHRALRQKAWAPVRRPTSGRAQPPPRMRAHRRWRKPRARTRCVHRRRRIRGRRRRSPTHSHRA